MVYGIYDVKHVQHKETITGCQDSCKHETEQGAGLMYIYTLTH